MASGRHNGPDDPGRWRPRSAGERAPPISGWNEIEADAAAERAFDQLAAVPVLAGAGDVDPAAARRLARLLGWCLTLVIVVPMLAGIVLLAVRLVVNLLAG